MIISVPSITSSIRLLRLIAYGGAIWPSKFVSASSAVSNGLLSFDYSYGFNFISEFTVSFRLLSVVNSLSSLVDAVSVSV